MAGFTNYGENLVINEVLRSRQLYVGLMKANPEEAGNSSSEVNAISYERQSIQYIEPKLGETYNHQDIQFPTATEDWGWITHIAIFDSKENGNMILFSALDFKKEIRAADIYKIPRAYLIFSID